MDATIIEASGSTKNERHERDPQMHQTKKGNEWHFGMKAHIGVDAASVLVHTLVTTPSNVADIAKTTKLLHGEEEIVYADADYTGIEKWKNNGARSLGWYLKGAAGFKRWLRVWKRKLCWRRNTRSLGSFPVEHPFHYIKNLFGYGRTHYQGLDKNESRLFVLFASTNLLIAGRRNVPVPS